MVLLTFLVFGQTYSQIYIPADPFNLIQTEKTMLSENNFIPTQIRPIFRPISKNNNWSLKARSEFFYNTDAPNLENMSDRWIGKGAGFFSSVHVVYRNKFIVVSAEPYYFVSQNSDYDEPERLPKFSVLNDNRPHLESPYDSYGVRELQVYANYKGVGAGISNANIWWGPGLHTSTLMTNNTSGFGHIFIGTLEEKRINNWGFNGRYIFSKFDDNSKYEPYYTLVFADITYHSNPQISIGIHKEALIGGTHKSTQQDSVEWQQAAFSLFRGIFSQKDLKWSQDDHAGGIYISSLFRKSKLLLFFEMSRTTVFPNLWSLIVLPDHNAATNFGARKYGLFGEEKLFFALEYFQNINPRSAHRVSGHGDWYAKRAFDYNAYNGRRWAAHSGSDSDDFLLSFGWLDRNISILPSFNYERHRVARNPTEINKDLITDGLNKLPETKLEFRLDLRYKYKAYNLNLYYEREVTLNLAHSDKTRRGQVFWFGIERDLDMLFK